MDRPVGPQWDSPQEEECHPEDLVDPLVNSHHVDNSLLKDNSRNKVVMVVALPVALPVDMVDFPANNKCVALPADSLLLPAPLAAASSVGHPA